jgi:serine protease Do
MPDGKKYKAKTLGSNTGIDSGMIQIIDKAPEAGWPAVEVGTTDNLTAGQWTVALGHPGGYQKGRPPVARLGRVIMASNRAIYTDNTLINGDSGGPLFDLDGKLVGIHSRIGMLSSQNIHVPINTYTETWDRLASGEQWGRNTFSGERPASRVSLGCTVNEDPKGCIVTKVNEGSPAAAAGLMVGDIIQKFGTREIKTPDDMLDVLTRQRPDTKVQIAVLREDKPMVIEPVLGRRR